MEIYIPTSEIPSTPCPSVHWLQGNPQSDLKPFMPSGKQLIERFLLGETQEERPKNTYS